MDKFLKSQVRATAFVMLFLILFHLCGCSEGKPSVLAENDYSNIGNMYILATLIQDGENIFYVDSDTNTLYKTEKADHSMQNAVCLGEGIKRAFLLDNDLICYVNTKDQDSIYSMDKNGDNPEKIMDMTCNELVALQNRVYFSNSDGLYSINYDGSDLKEIKLGNISNIHPYQSDLYYIETVDHLPKIFKFNLDDNGINEIGGEFVQRFFIFNDKIYFLRINDLCTINIDGSDLSRITQYSLIIKEAMNVCGKYLIYSILYNGAYTYALDTTNGNNILIAKDAYQFIFVVNDVLITDEGAIDLE